jgi:molybdopterin molybdotransferase
MDGYAFMAADLAGVVDRADKISGQVLSRAGESLAGHPFHGTLQPGECIRITTGAAVPASADTVVIQENCRIDGSRIELINTPVQGSNIRTIGHDIMAGATLCQRGKRLNPFDIGWLAACGLNQVEVVEKPHVAIFSTGDELVRPGQPIADGQIFDANRAVLKTLLDRLPVTVTDLGILPDDRDLIEAELARAAAQNDLLLTSGGVSVGDADFVRDVVESIGAIELWRLNLKPGKPLAFGTIGKALFLGLPGNPVSAIVTYLLIAQPLLLALSNAEVCGPAIYNAILRTPIRHTSGREEYQRGISELSNGDRCVRVSGDQSSNRLATFADADCFIRIPKDVGDLPSGAEVEILPFFGLVD